jgi:ABC-2 type transport system permease protein
MLAIVIMIFKLSLFVYGIMIIPFFTVLFLFGIAIGVFGSALVLHFGPASEWFIWPLPALISPFVGVLYPVSTLPAWMQSVAHVLPPSYVFEGLRTIVAGKGFSGGTLVIGALLAVVYIILAYLFFVKVYKRSLRTGQLVRYNAENLG